MDKTAKKGGFAIITSIKKELKKNIGLYVIVLVPLLFLALFAYAPMYGVQIAFRNYTPVRTITGSPFVGMRYFIKFFESRMFWTLLRNTISISLYSLATFPCAILLALMLNYMPSARFKKFVQLISYAPYFISTVVMVGLILQFLDARSGLINIVITALGGEAISFMRETQHFYSIYVWSGVWQGIGYSSIIYIAALSGVSPELHEAAIVDGANILRRIWHIDLPSILPTISIMLILSCGNILSIGYEKIFLMQNDFNVGLSEVINTYVYKQGMSLKIPQYSYGTAIGLFVSVINVILLIVVNSVVKKLSKSSLW